MSRRGYSGINKLRRTIRRMDDEVSGGIKKEIKSAAQSIEMDMLGMVPVDEGDLARSIAYKLGRDGLTAVIGPAADSVQIKKGFGGVDLKYTKSGNLTAATIRNQKARFELYKAHWVEFGTKQGKPGSSAQPARPFIQPAYDANKDRFTKRVKDAVAKAIEVSSSE